MLLAYRICAWTCVPVVWLISAFVPKVRRGLALRHGLAERIEKWRKAHPAPLWFHVASSGEFEQAVAVFEALKQRSDTPIVVTYFSPTAGRAIELEAERRRQAGVPIPWDASDSAPYDLAGSCSRFLDALRPRALIVVQREWWPEMFFQASKRQIPIYLVAVHVNPSSRRLLPFIGRLLPRVRYVGAVSESSLTSLRRAVDCELADCGGDPRVDRVFQQIGRAHV